MEAPTGLNRGNDGHVSWMLWHVKPGAYVGWAVEVASLMTGLIGSRLCQRDADREQHNQIRPSSDQKRRVFRDVWPAYQLVGRVTASPSLCLIP